MLSRHGKLFLLLTMLTLSTLPACKKTATSSSNDGTPTPSMPPVEAGNEETAPNDEGPIGFAVQGTFRLIIPKEQPVQIEYTGLSN